MFGYGLAKFFYRIRIVMHLVMHFARFILTTSTNASASLPTVEAFVHDAAFAGIEWTHPTCGIS